MIAQALAVGVREAPMLHRAGVIAAVAGDLAAAGSLLLGVAARR